MPAPTAWSLFSTLHVLSRCQIFQNPDVSREPFLCSQCTPKIVFGLKIKPETRGLAKKLPKANGHLWRYPPLAEDNFGNGLRCNAQ
jgi:hypothetical protein